MSDEPTPYDKFKALAKKVVAVPKAEVGKRKPLGRKRGTKRRAK